MNIARIAHSHVKGGSMIVVSYNDSAHRVYVPSIQNKPLPVNPDRRKISRKAFPSMREAGNFYLAKFREYNQEIIRRIK